MVWLYGKGRRFLTGRHAELTKTQREQNKMQKGFIIVLCATAVAVDNYNESAGT